MALLATSCTMRNKPSRLLDKGPEYLRTRTNEQMFESHRQSAVELLAASRPQYVKGSPAKHSPAKNSPAQDSPVKDTPAVPPVDPPDTAPDRLHRSIHESTALSPICSQAEVDRESQPESVDLPHRVQDDRVPLAPNALNAEEDPPTDCTERSGADTSAVPEGLDKEEVGQTTQEAVEQDCDRSYQPGDDEVPLSSSRSPSPGPPPLPARSPQTVGKDASDGEAPVVYTARPIFIQVSGGTSLTRPPIPPKPVIRAKSAPGRCSGQGSPAACPALPTVSPLPGVAISGQNGTPALTSLCRTPIKRSSTIPPPTPPKPTSGVPPPTPPKPAVRSKTSPVAASKPTPAVRTKFTSGSQLASPELPPAEMSEESSDKTPTNPSVEALMPAEGPASQATTPRVELPCDIPGTAEIGVSSILPAPAPAPASGPTPVLVQTPAPVSVSLPAPLSAPAPLPSTCSSSSPGRRVAARSSGEFYLPPASPVPRSFSDISCRHSRAGSDVSSEASRTSRASRASAGAHLERFFNEMGMDREVLDPMMQLQQRWGGGPDSVRDLYDSVSSLDSHDAHSICSALSRSEREISDTESFERNQQQTSIVERNARIIKWLCSVKKAKTPASSAAS